MIKNLHEKPINTYLVLLPLVAVLDAALWVWLYTNYGWEEASAQVYTRYTARVAFFLFLVAFIASSLFQLKPSDFTRGLLQRRRQWGLSFAFAHLIHMGAIIALYRLEERSFSADDAAALTIYFLIGLMALTSNNFSVKLLGKGWKVLHKIGIYGIFIGFAFTYVNRLNSRQVSLPPGDVLHEWFFVYFMLAALVMTGLFLRVTAFWMKKIKPNP